MPKLPLVGPPYASRSLAAAASETTNLYGEVIENPADQSKNTANLFGTPGRHPILSPAAQATIAANHGGNVRGLWSGGGRLFTVVGKCVYEIDEAGDIVPGSTLEFLASDDLPVQFFGNGNQLGLVYTKLTGGLLDGTFFINNGPAWEPARFEVNGTVSVSGLTVTWTSGDPNRFSDPGAWYNLFPFTINGQDVLVDAFVDATHLTLTSASAPVGGSGTAILLYDGTVKWVTGAGGGQFSAAWKGLKITLGGVDYTIFEVLDPLTLTLNPRGAIWTATTGAAVAYAVTLPNLSYTAAAGDLVSAITGAYLDGAFHVQRPSTVGNGSQINFSAVLNGISWPGLNFYSKEGGPDHIRSIFTDGEILYALGTETSEAFQNNPSTGLPQRLPGAMVKFGSISTWGEEVMAGKAYFVGGDAEGGVIAYRVDSTIPTRISTHGQEAYWLKQCFGKDCISYSYMEEGHVFWCINFSRAGDAGIGETWVWDETTKLWHRRMSWDGAHFGPDPTKFHTYIPEWGGGDGKHITGGVGSQIYESSASFYDNDGADMAWRRAIPYRYNAGNFTYFGRMTLEMETGTVASGPAPVVTRDYSDNRGKTFTNPRDASTGVHDDNSIRLYWLRNGASRGRVWRLFGKGKSKVALIDLECDETLGTT